MTAFLAGTWDEIKYLIFFFNSRLYKTKIFFVAQDTLTNFDGLKCPDYELIHKSIECAVVVKIIAHLIF